MRSDGYRREADLDPAPNQYPVGVPCASCNRPLSRYNGYTICGPCRYRIATTIVDDYAEDQLDAPDHWSDTEPVYKFDRFPKRRPVQREGVEMAEEAA